MAVDSFYGWPGDPKRESQSFSPRDRMIQRLEQSMAKGSVMRIVVIGGSGLIGSKLVPQLREQGHEAIAASPRSGVNTVTGEGLPEALKGASVVVDVSNAPSWDDAAVMEFFE